MNCVKKCELLSGELQKNVDFDPTDQSPLSNLVEGRDYYIENGFWIFTSHYLKKKGKCCKNGCKNCPFKKK